MAIVLDECASGSQPPNGDWMILFDEDGLNR